MDMPKVAQLLGLVSRNAKIFIYGLLGAFICSCFSQSNRELVAFFLQKGLLIVAMMCTLCMLYIKGLRNYSYYLIKDELLEQEEEEFDWEVLGHLIDCDEADLEAMFGDEAPEAPEVEPDDLEYLSENFYYYDDWASDETLLMEILELEAHVAFLEKEMSKYNYFPWCLAGQQPCPFKQFKKKTKADLEIWDLKTLRQYQLLQPIVSRSFGAIAAAGVSDGEGEGEGDDGCDVGNGCDSDDYFVGNKLHSYETLYDLTQTFEHDLFGSKGAFDEELSYENNQSNENNLDSDEAAGDFTIFGNIYDLEDDIVCKHLENVFVVNDNDNDEDFDCQVYG